MVLDGPMIPLHAADACRVLLSQAPLRPRREKHAGPRGPRARLGGGDRPRRALGALVRRVREARALAHPPRASRPRLATRSRQGELGPRRPPRRLRARLRRRAWEAWPPAPRSRRRRASTRAPFAPNRRRSRCSPCRARPRISSRSSLTRTGRSSIARSRPVTSRGPRSSSRGSIEPSLRSRADSSHRPGRSPRPRARRATRGAGEPGRARRRCARASRTPCGRGPRSTTSSWSSPSRVASSPRRLTSTGTLCGPPPRGRSRRPRASPRRARPTFASTRRTTSRALASASTPRGKSTRRSAGSSSSWTAKDTRSRASTRRRRRRRWRPPPSWRSSVTWTTPAFLLVVATNVGNWTSAVRSRGRRVGASRLAAHGRRGVTVSRHAGGRARARRSPSRAARRPTGAPRPR